MNTKNACGEKHWFSLQQQIEKIKLFKYYAEKDKNIFCTELSPLVQELTVKGKNVLSKESKFIPWRVTSKKKKANDAMSVVISLVGVYVHLKTGASNGAQL